MAAKEVIKRISDFRACNLNTISKNVTRCVVTTHGTCQVYLQFGVNRNWSGVWCSAFYELNILKGSSFHDRYLWFLWNSTENGQAESLQKCNLPHREILLNHLDYGQGETNMKFCAQFWQIFIVSPIVWHAPSIFEVFWKMSGMKRFKSKPMKLCVRHL